MLSFKLQVDKVKMGQIIGGFTVISYIYICLIFFIYEYIQCVKVYVFMYTLLTPHFATRI